jgi:ATP-dependent Clp protease protease subunit
MKFIKPRVITLGSGWVASAGALIFVGADKTDRYALPNTRFLLHQPSGGAGGMASDIEIQVRGHAAQCNVRKHRAKSALPLR